MWGLDGQCEERFNERGQGCGILWAVCEVPSHLGTLLYQVRGEGVGNEGAATRVWGDPGGEGRTEECGTSAVHVEGWNKTHLRLCFLVQAV